MLVIWQGRLFYGTQYISVPAMQKQAYIVSQKSPPFISVSGCFIMPRPYNRREH